MKKLFAVLLCLLIGCSILCAPASQAQEETGTLISQEVEYLADGSKIVTCVYEYNQGIATAASTVTKSGKKTQTGYNSDGDLNWSLTVHGTFSVVTGSSATCTASSYSYTTGSNWSLKTGSATKSANKATANGTFVRKLLGITTKTENASVTLTCSTSGTLS